MTAPGVATVTVRAPDGLGAVPVSAPDDGDAGTAKVVSVRRRRGVALPSRAISQHLREGSQSAGMGADLFDHFPDLVAAADAILGYPVRELCLSNDGRLFEMRLVSCRAVNLVANTSFEVDVDVAAGPDNWGSDTEEPIAEQIAAAVLLDDLAFAPSRRRLVRHRLVVVRVEVGAQRLDRRDAAFPQQFRELTMNELDAAPVGLDAFAAAALA